MSGDDFDLDLDAAFAGQSNGLCGAASPGFLYLLTGLHTGNVTFTVEAHDEPPPIDDSWQEIVEVSFEPASSKVSLVEWAGEDSSLDLEQRPYRVRYCAAGIDEGYEMDTPGDKEQTPDRYLLQFWPSARRPDQVVKQTSEKAAYWHAAARNRSKAPEQHAKAG